MLPSNHNTTGPDSSRLTRPSSDGAIATNDTPSTSLAASSSSQPSTSVDACPSPRGRSFPDTPTTVLSVCMASQLLWLFVHACITKRPTLTRANIEEALDVFAKQLLSAPSEPPSLLPHTSHTLFDALTACEYGVDVLASLVHKLVAAVLSRKLWVAAPIAPCSLAALVYFILAHAVESGVCAADAVVALTMVGADIHVVDARGATPLVFTAKASHTALGKALIAAGADVNAWTIDGNTPLLRAIECQNAALVRLLIDAKANVQVRVREPHKGWPLAMASCERDVSIVRMLLAAKAELTFNGHSPLVDAAAAGQAEAVRALVDAGATLDKCERMDWYWLMRALERGHTATVKALLDAGIIVATQTRYGGMPLWLAIQGNHVELVELLLAANAPVEHKDSMGVTPLLQATSSYEDSTAVVQVLLAARANVASVDRDGYTALMRAASGGHLSCVRLLLDARAVIDARNRERRTALMLAIIKGHEEVATALIVARADVHVRDNEGNTPLLLAAPRASAELVQVLLDANVDIEARDGHGCTPLLRAASGSNAAVVQVLLSARADVWSEDDEGVTPLQAACTGRHDAEVVHTLLRAGAVFDAAVCDALLLRAVRPASTVCVGVVKVLLDAGANVNVRDARGDTPLLLVADGWRPDILQLLLDAKADLEQRDEKGRTPLLVATARSKDYLPNVELLLAAKADVESVDAEGCTALMLAGEYQLGILKALLDAGAVTSAEQRSQLLLLAARKGHVGVATAAIDAGVSVDACVDDDGNTPLLLAARGPSRDLERAELLQAELASVELVQLLLGARTKVKHRNAAGATPLHQAAEGGNLSVVQVLLAAQADVESVAQDGDTPLCKAARAGHLKVMQLLLDTGAVIDVGKRGELMRCVAGRGDVDVAQVLLDMGADVHERGKDGDTALCGAVDVCHGHMIQFLLNAKADVNQRGRQGRTPLFRAIASNRLHTMYELLAAKADVACADDGRDTMLMVATRNGHERILRMLLVHAHETLTRPQSADTSAVKRRRRGGRGRGGRGRGGRGGGNVRGDELTGDGGDGGDGGEDSPTLEGGSAMRRKRANRYR